jgi:RHS repeat-associated protein
VQPIFLAYLRLIVLHRIFTFYRLQIIQQQLGQLSPLVEEETDDDVFLWYLLWGARYTGQEYDPETGFYYYNARYYDPQLGVFTTPDTKFDKNNGSFGFNRHMYVGGNPIMYNDPSGHFAFLAALVPVLIAAAKGAAVGAAVGAASSVLAQAAANNWDFKQVNGMKVLEGAAFGAGVGALTGGAGYFLNSASTVSSMGSTLGVSNAAITQTALNAGSLNMISMFGAGERDGGKLFGYFGAGFASGAFAATSTAAMGLAGNAMKNSLGARMLSKYGMQATLSFARSGFNKMVDSKNNLGFSVWGANFSFTKDGFRASASIPFAASQGVALLNGAYGELTGTGKLGWDTETLSLTSDRGLIGQIQDLGGKGKWGGLAIHSVLRYNGDKDTLNHELGHVWQSRFAGDDWLGQYGMGLANGNGGYCGNYYEVQAYTMGGDGC